MLGYIFGSRLRTVQINILQKIFYFFGGKNKFLIITVYVLHQNIDITVITTLKNLFNLFLYFDFYYVSS